MSHLDTFVCTPASLKPKRKHVDEEAQFYADEEDYWKRPRTCPSPSGDADMLMDGEGDADAIQDDDGAVEVSSTRTEGSASPDVVHNSLNDDDITTMDIEFERQYSPAAQTATTMSHMYTGTPSGNELSWSMLHDLKALRQQSPQAALQKSSEARREVMRFLWRTPSSSRNSTVVNR